MADARLIRRAVFSASHRLSDSRRSHGHNYELEVCVRGPIDEETGMLMDLKWLKEVIAEQVESRFDHRDLNDDTPFFREIPPTAENVARVIFDLLDGALPKGALECVRLRPTDALEVEVGR